MVIRTRCFIPRMREEIWPLLTNSEMNQRGCFCLGLPKPVRCELPEKEGFVGAERRCVSDRGVVIQTIQEWTPCERLRFRMVSTDHSWASWVESIEEHFLLESVPNGARVTRTTTVRAKAPLRVVKEMMLWVGLKRVHFYVFKNWKRTKAGQE